MNAEKPINVGVVGLGWAGETHIKAYRQVPGVRVVAVADPRPELLARIAETYEIPHAYADYTSVVARDDLDAISVCTPNFLHAPVAVAALESGKHVLCEKPLAHTYAAAQEIVTAAERAGRVLEMAFNHRRRGDVRVLRSLIEDGALGRVYYAKAYWVRRQGIPGIGRWFTVRETSGGGPLIDLGVHVLDMALHLMGEPEAVTVSGATYAEFGPRGQGMRDRADAVGTGGYDVEDLAVAFVRLAGGGTLHLEASWAMHRPKGDLFGVTLYGTDGGATLDIVNYAQEDTLRVFTEVAGVAAVLAPEPLVSTGHAGVAREFVDAIRGGDWAAHTGRAALHRSAIIEAAYRSAEAGREVRLTELAGG